VDSYSTYQFIATGSAAAALKLKSKESGAGRFTDSDYPFSNNTKGSTLLSSQKCHFVCCISRQNLCVFIKIS
jgi:hypothetical protein